MNQIPFPYDRAILQPMLYTLETFPAAINTTYLSLLPGAERLINRVIVAVANEISQTANSSPARMFAYNTLSANGWNNDYFRETCQFTANYIVYREAKGQAVSLQDAVGRSLSVIVCVIAAGCQAFMSMLDAQTQQRIYKNIATYKDINTEYSLFSQMPNQQMVGNGAGVVQNMGMLSQPATRFRHPALEEEVAMAPQTTQTRFGPVTTTSTMHAPIPKPVNTTPATQKPVEETFVRSNFPTIKQDIQPTMDETKHLSIYGTTSDQKNLETTKAVLSAIETQSVKRQEIEEGKVHLSNDTVIVFSEDLLLSIARSEAACRAAEGVSIQHDVGVILDPVFSIENLDPLTEILAKSNTFTYAAARLQEFYHKSLNEPSARSSLAVVSSIDVWLTRAVNRFLASLTARRALSIDSFIEDIGSVSQYLIDKVGASQHKAFQDFQAKALKTWFKEHRNDNEVPSFIQDSPVNYMLLARRVAVSHLSTSLLECGLTNLTHHNIIRVSSKPTPMLYKMLAEANAIVSRTMATEHIFMTLDGLEFYVETPEYEPGTILLIER